MFPDFHRLAAVLGRITHKADIIDTGTASWRFRHGLSVNDATSVTPTGKCARDNRHKSLRAALGLRVDGHRNYSPPHDRKTQREVVPFPASPPVGSNADGCSEHPVRQLYTPLRQLPRDITNQGLARR